MLADLCSWLDRGCAGEHISDRKKYMFGDFDNDKCGSCYAVMSFCEGNMPFLDEKPVVVVVDRIIFTLML